MSGNGVHPTSADKSLGEIVAEVSEKASLLVRQEIELAKAEVTEQGLEAGHGAPPSAVAAGVFLVFGVTMFLHALAWFINDLVDWDEPVWPGFAIVTSLLFILAVIAGLLAYRFFKRGSPPVPAMAIEQAKLRATSFEAQTIQRDQVGRTLEKGEELKK